MPRSLTPKASASLQTARPLDRSLWAALATIAGRSPSSATSAVPVRDSVAAAALRLELIASARTAIVASTYGITPDEGGVAFLDALIAARRRGVAVVLTLDATAHAFSSIVGTKTKEIDYRLRELSFYGGHVVFYGGPSEQAHELGAGSHLKMLSIDGARLLIGGRNIGKNFETWPDYDVLFDGEIAARVLNAALPFLRRGDAVSERAWLDRAEASRAYTRTLADLRALSKRQLARATAVSPAAGPLYLPIIGDPLRARGMHDGGATPTTTALVRAIDAARRSLVMSSNFARPVPVIREALLRAVARGVDVVVITTGASGAALSQLPYIDACDDYAWMRRHGITVIETRKMEHAKLYLFDDDVLAFGSYNLEAHADRRLVESLVFTNDDKLIRAAKDALFDTAMNRSESEADKERATRYTALERLWLGLQAFFGSPFF